MQMEYANIICIEICTICYVSKYVECAMCLVQIYKCIIHQIQIYKCFMW